MNYGDYDISEEEADDNADILSVERKRKAKRESLRRHAGEPEKPGIQEILKLKDGFLVMLRGVLA